MRITASLLLSSGMYEEVVQVFDACFPSGIETSDVARMAGAIYNFNVSCEKLMRSILGYDKCRYCSLCRLQESSVSKQVNAVRQAEGIRDFFAVKNSWYLDERSWNDTRL